MEIYEEKNVLKKKKKILFSNANPDYGLVYFMCIADPDCDLKNHNPDPGIPDNFILWVFKFISYYSNYCRNRYINYYNGDKMFISRIFSFIFVDF